MLQTDNCQMLQNFTSPRFFCDNISRYVVKINIQNTVSRNILCTKIQTDGSEVTNLFHMQPNYLPKFQDSAGFNKVLYYVCTHQ